MNWNNLKQNKCPDCGKSLANAWNPKLMAFNCECGFKIGEKRMKEIVASQVTRTIDQEKHYRPADENPDF